MLVRTPATYLYLALLGLVCSAGCVSTSSHGLPSTMAQSHRVEVSTSSEIEEAHALYMSGVISELRGETEEARQYFARALKLDPSNRELVLDLSQQLIQEKKFEEAAEMLSRSASISGASGTLYSRLGAVYLLLGRDADAELACQRAIQLPPQEIEPYRTLYQLRARKGRPLEALEVLKLASSATGFPQQDTIELAELYVALNRQAPSQSVVISSNGIAVLDRLASAKPGDVHFRMRMGDDYVELGALDKGREVLATLISTMADNTALRLQIRERLVRIYLHQNNQDAAAAQLKAVVEEEPSSFPSYYLLGKIADDQHRLQDALGYYKTAVALGGASNPEYYYDLARVQIDAGLPDDALETIRVVTSRFQAGFAAEILSAIAYERKLDYASAVAHYTAAEVIAKATEPARLTSRFYFDEGAAYERAGNMEQAEASLLKSLHLDPENAETMNYLGYMWADKGVKLEQALDYVQKALKIEPKSAAYLDSLGWVFYKMNRLEEAMSRIQEAVALSEKPDPTLFEHLGDVFAKLNKPVKAREAWGKSLKLEPNKAVEQKLDELGSKP